MKKQQLFYALVIIFTFALTLTGQNNRQVLFLKPGKINAAISKIQNRKFTDSIVLTGNPGNGNWARLFSALSKLDHLRYLEFRDNDLFDLPEEIQSLKNVTAICIRENPDLDMDSVICSLKCIQVKSLGLDIVSIQELPKRINELTSLTSLQLYQMNDHDDFFDDGNSQEDFNIELLTVEYLLPVAFDDGSRVELRVRYTGFNAENLRDEMTWFGSFFPGTYDISDAEDHINSTTSSGSANANVFERKYVNIKPPIENVQIEKAYYSINALSGGRIDFFSGTVIEIPAQAFVDADGNSVTGNVVIDYREFRDPVDFILSGIPMTYDSGGVQNTFLSAGMFELNASVNGKEVFLAKDKTIDMQFASTDSASTFNFYVFKDGSNNWENIGKPGAATVQGRKIYKLSKAYLFYKPKSNPKSWEYDTLTFDQRFNDPDYFGLYKKDEAESKYTRRNGKRFKADRAVGISSATRNRKGELRFKIRHTSFVHPEMNAFSNVRWMLAEGEDIAGFKAAFSSKSFCDIRVERSGGEFEIFVKQGKNIKSFRAVPIEKNHENKWVELKDGGKSLYNRYRNKLMLRKRKFDRGLLNSRSFRRGRVIKNMKRFNEWLWAETRRRMNDSEKLMNRADWNKYVEKMYMQELSMMTKKQMISRNLTLNGFGVYNCDQIQRMEQPMYVRASYNDGKNKVEPQNIFVMSEGVNAVFSYGKEVYAGYSAKKFAMEKNKKTNIIVIDESGNLAIIKSDKVSAALEGTNNANFVVEFIDSEGITPEALKEKLSL